MLSDGECAVITKGPHAHAQIGNGEDVTTASADNLYSPSSCPSPPYLSTSKHAVT